MAFVDNRTCYWYQRQSYQSSELTKIQSFNYSQVLQHFGFKLGKEVIFLRFSVFSRNKNQLRYLIKTPIPGSRFWFIRFRVGSRKSCVQQTSQIVSWCKWSKDCDLQGAILMFFSDWDFVTSDYCHHCISVLEFNNGGLKYCSPNGKSERQVKKNQR